MLSTLLEDPIKTSIPASDQLKHVVIRAHGVPGAVLVSDLKTGRPTGMNGEKFAVFLYDRLQAASEGASQHLKSVHITACNLACRTEPSLGASNQSGISFPEDFARAAKPLFPEFEHVIATPYRMGSKPDIDGTSKIVLDVFSAKDRSNHESLRIRVTSEEFFSGEFPLNLFDPPSLGMVNSVYVRAPRESAAAGIGQYVRSAHPETISGFISSHDFSKPLFRKFPVPLLETPPTD